MKSLNGMVTWKWNRQMDKPATSQENAIMKPYTNNTTLAKYT